MTLARKQQGTGLAFKKKTYMTEGTTVRYKFESKMRSAVGDTKGRRADLIMPG